MANYIAMFIQLSHIMHTHKHTLNSAVPGLQVELPNNSSISEGVILTEGDDDVIIISVPEPHSIPVVITVSVSSDTAEEGEWTCV